MISKIALQTLCHYWGFTEQYLDQIIWFIRGVEWDENEEARLIAMSIAGRYCQHQSNPEIFKSLIDVFEDPREEGFIRRFAYESLGEAMRRDGRDIPSAKNPDVSIIEEAKSFLKKKKDELQ